jgi:ankyrin repeat protein
MKSILCAVAVAASALAAFPGELQQAAASGDVAKVRALIQANPGAVNERAGSTTALHEATRGGHFEVVKLLVASGADVNATDFSKLTPLRLALGYQRSAIAEYLRQHGGVEQVVPPRAAPPTNVVQANVASIAQPSQNLFATNVPAARTVAPPARPTTNAVVGTPASANKPPSEREMLLINFPIHEAARMGEVETIKLLFKNSPDVIDATDEKGFTPLHVAALNKQIKTAEALIGLRARLNPKTVSGQTPLHLAVRRGDLAIVSLLLTNGAIVDERDNLGHTPLLLALQSASAEALEIAGGMIDRQTDAHSRLKPGGDMTELLIRARAEVSQRSETVIGVLLRAGANPNVAETGTGKTPLHFAAALGHAPIIEMLVRHRAAVDAMDRRGETPLCYALREARSNSIATLRAAGATIGKTRPLNGTEQSLVEFYQRTETALQRANSSEKARILMALNPTKTDCEKMFPRHSAPASKTVDEINKQIRQAFAHPVHDAEQGKEIWRVLPDSPSVIVQEWRGRGALATNLPVYSLVVDKIGGTTRPGDYCFVNGRWVLVPPLRTIAAQVASAEAGRR